MVFFPWHLYGRRKVAGQDDQLLQAAQRDLAKLQKAAKSEVKTLPAARKAAAAEQARIDGTWDQAIKNSRRTGAM